MFYYIFVFILVSFFMWCKERKSHMIRCSILAMACYTAALITFTLYIAKDSYYYNAIDYLFSIPLPVWNKIMFISIPSGLLIRMLNFFTLATIFFSMQFTCDWLNYSKRKSVLKIMLGVFIIEWILYDPAFCKMIYLVLYPNFLNYRQFSLLQSGIHFATVLFNTGSIVLELWLFWENYRKSSPIRLIKLSAASIAICHGLIMISYVMLFGYYPACLIKVSKVAGIISYVTAPMIRKRWFTMFFPYYLLVSFVLICVCIYRTTLISSRMEDKSLTISKQISAADTTSKVFCHYIKNEILAIQSEIEFLDPTEDQKETFSEIEKRCQSLYERLDLLHKSTKASTLTLTENNVSDILKHLLQNFSYELQEYHAECILPKEPLPAMIDETYFYQALHNIVTNAIDAMKECPDSNRKLTLSAESIHNWICIRISDTGKGIPADVLPKVFAPFYSSYPTKAHWGIGLSLTYKIITAHEGHIDIESEIGKGTTVKILIPQISTKNKPNEKE